MGESMSHQLQRAYDVLGPGWTVASRHEGMIVWRQDATGEEIEQHRIETQDAKDYLRYKQVYNYRFQSETLVASKFWRQSIENDMCSTIYRADLYLERIPRRLGQLAAIPQTTVFDVYIRSFKGFRDLYDKIGPFNIDEDMICFNQRGEIKVWVNPDLTATEPTRQHYGSSLRGEAEMVMRIVELVVRKSVPYKQIGVQILNQHPSTFQQAIEIAQALNAQPLANFYQPEDQIDKDLRVSNISDPRKHHTSVLNQSKCSDTPDRFTRRRMSEGAFILTAGATYNNNINMSIPVSLARPLNQNTRLATNVQNLNGGTRDIHGKSIQFPPTLVRNQQQLVEARHPQPQAQTVIGSTGSLGQLFAPSSVPRGQVGQATIRQPSHLRAVGSPLGVHTIPSTIPNITLIPGGVTTRQSPVTVRKSIILDQRNTIPVGGRQYSPLMPNGVIGHVNESILSADRVRSLGKINQQQVPIQIDRFRGSPVLVETQQLSPPTEVYREQTTQIEYVLEGLGGDPYFPGIIGRSDQSSGIVDDLLLGNLVRQKSNFSSHIQSQIEDQTHTQINSPGVEEVGVKSVSISGPVLISQIPFLTSARPVAQAVPISTSSRLSNTMAKIQSGLVQTSVYQNNQPQRVVAQNIYPVQTRASEFTQTVPVTLIGQKVQTGIFDFSKVRDNPEYTSPEIRKLLMTNPPPRKPFEPVFVADSKIQDSPIKRTQGYGFISHQNPQVNTQFHPQSYIQVNRNEHLGGQSHQVPLGPSRVYNQPPRNVAPTPTNNPYVNTNQQAAYQIPVHHGFAPQTNQNQYVHHPITTQQTNYPNPTQHHYSHQMPMSSGPQILNPHYQHLQTHPANSAAQSMGIPFNMPMDPSAMMAMGGMMSMMPGGIVLEEMISPVIQVGIDENGDEYMEVDVGMLPMMMGMSPMMMGMGPMMGMQGMPGMPGMPMGPMVQVDMGMGIPFIIPGVNGMGGPMMSEMMFMNSPELEDMSPEELMQMMTGAPTRVVRGPTGRIVQVQGGSDSPAQPFHGSAYYPGAQHSHQVNHSQMARQQQLRRQEMQQQQAEQQRLYAQYQAQVQKLLQKKERLVNQDQLINRQELQDLEQGEFVHETVYTSVTVQQANGNVYQTNTTEEVTIQSTGERMYVFDEENIEYRKSQSPTYTLHNQGERIDVRPDIYSRQQYTSEEEQKVQDPDSRNYQGRGTYDRVYQTSNQGRAQSNRSRGSGSGSGSGLMHGKISEPLAFGISKNPKGSVSSSTQNAGYSTEQFGQGQGYNYQRYAPNVSGSQDVSSSYNYHPSGSSGYREQESRRTPVYTETRHY